MNHNKNKKKDLLVSDKGLCISIKQEVEEWGILNSSANYESPAEQSLSSF